MYFKLISNRNAVIDSCPHQRENPYTIFMGVSALIFLFISCVHACLWINSPELSSTFPVGNWIQFDLAEREHSVFEMD